MKHTPSEEMRKLIERISINQRKLSQEAKNANIADINGIGITVDELEEWIDSWDTKNEKEMPIAHKLY